MKDGFMIGLATVGGIAGLMALSYGGLHWSGFLRGEAEAIRYDVLKESQAHRDGMQRNLSQMQQQYIAADSAGKVAIKAAVLHQYSQADTSEYPAYLQAFLSDMGVY